LSGISKKRDEDENERGPRDTLRGFFRHHIASLLTLQFIRHATGRDFAKVLGAQAIRVNRYIKPLAGVLLATSINENDS
jgi:hypothetical protein